MPKPTINYLEFYLVKIEEVNRWDDNYEAYGVSTKPERAKDEALDYLPGDDWEIVSFWKYLDGEWYEQDKRRLEG